MNKRTHLSEALGLAEVAERKSRKDPEERLCVSCHASHITVDLSKAAHSGPSVCLRASPLRVSRPGADRASVQRKLQVLALPRGSLGQDRLIELDVKLTHGGTGRTQLRFLTPFHAQWTLLCGPYRRICVCARSTAVFHGVYGRSPLLTTSLFWH
jgi:hypothetical protein